MNDSVGGANCAGETISPGRHCGIVWTDEGQVCAPSCFRQVRLNGFDSKTTGNLAGIAAAHAVADDVQSEQRVGHKAIFVMGSFKACIGFGAM